MTDPDEINHVVITDDELKEHVQCMIEYGKIAKLNRIELAIVLSECADFFATEEGIEIGTSVEYDGLFN